MCPDPRPPDLINSFSLVSYIPGSLGVHLDRLRRELVASCVAQSHVTVLPPRPVVASPQQVLEKLRQIVPSFAPFRVEIIGVEIFPVTNVVYGEVGEGREELLEMHDRLNRDVLQYDEPFKYHPHITLAQNLSPEEVEHTYKLALATWRELPYRSFTVDTLWWVQNTLENRWLDLADYELRGAPTLKR